MPTAWITSAKVQSKLDDLFLLNCSIWVSRVLGSGTRGSALCVSSTWHNEFDVHSSANKSDFSAGLKYRCYILVQSDRYSSYLQILLWQCFLDIIMLPYTSLVFLFFFKVINFTRWIFPRFILNYLLVICLVRIVTANI